MIFWITVAVMLISWIGFAMCNHLYNPKYRILCDGFAITSMVVGIVASIITFIMILIIISGHCGLDAYVASSYERYDALVYQYENNIYDNDNDLGKRELIRDIQDWNEDLATHKTNQYDFWIGILTPNIYDQFAFIEWEEE